MRAWSAILLFFSGLMGASGVGLAAYAAHQDGGAVLSTAAMFMLLHGVAVAALALGGTASRGLLIAATLLAVGAHLFSGSITLHMMAGVTALTFTTPLGGIVMIAGWLVVAVSALAAKWR